MRDLWSDDPDRTTRRGDTRTAEQVTTDGFTPAPVGKIQVRDTFGRTVDFSWGDAYWMFYVRCPCCAYSWHKGANGYLYRFLDRADANDVATLVGGVVCSFVSRA